MLNPAFPIASNPGEVPLTPNNSPEEDGDRCEENPENPEFSQEVPEGAPAAGDASDANLRAPCSTLAELSLGRMEGYCLPGSLPVLLELRESSSEAGSSSQTPQSPEGPDEFFDTQESMELWLDSPESPSHLESPLEAGATNTAEP